MSVGSMGLIDRVRQQTSEYKKSVAEHHRIVANVYYTQVIDEIHKASESGESQFRWDGKVTKNVTMAICCWTWSYRSLILLPWGTCLIIIEMLRKEGFVVSTRRGYILIKW